MEYNSDVLDHLGNDQGTFDSSDYQPLDLDNINLVSSGGNMNDLELFHALSQSASSDSLFSSAYPTPGSNTNAMSGQNQSQNSSQREGHHVAAAGLGAPPQFMQRGHQTGMQPQRQLSMSQRSTPTPSSAYNMSSSSHATDAIRAELAKQMKLQQLQQMQTQLLQQQLDLLSPGNSEHSWGPFRDTRFSELPTPGSSVTTSPNVPPEFLTPMMFQQNQQIMTTNDDLAMAFHSLVTPSSASATNHSATAPASIVFRNPAHNLNMLHDFSPLTSPALGPTMYSGHHSDFRHTPSTPSTSFPTSPDPKSISKGTDMQIDTSYRKRRSSVSESSQRKRMSPVVRAVGQGSMAAPSTSTNTSASARTAGRSTRSGAAASGAQPHTPRPSVSDGNAAAAGASESDGGAQNTPSPVDLSMPSPTGLGPSSAENQSSSVSTVSPVTPGSIMNLHHLSSLATSLVPPPGTRGEVGSSHGRPVTTAADVESIAQTEALATIQRKPSTRGKGAASSKRTNTAPSGTLSQEPGAASSRRKTTSQANIRPRPAIDTAKETAVAMSVQLDTVSPSQGGPGTDDRRGVHKSAEQRRRDALKAGFDDLRLLLPPITFDPDADAGEVIPGSNPPRGPLRSVAGVDNHPNRGVSKLALLRSSTEYIGKLKKRVDRRDELIEKMRSELEALRLEVGVGVGAGAGEHRGVKLLDLDEDVDAVEREEA